MAKGRKTGGRKMGSANKVTAEVKALAQKYGSAAVHELSRLALNAESEAARVAAIKELLDRGYGKSMQPVIAKVGVDRGLAELTDEELTTIIVSGGRS